MNIGHVQQSRPAYYDRNAVVVVNAYAATVGPHVTTTRWAYTVPTGKKAFWNSAQVSATRVTVAAPVGEVDIRIRVTPPGGAGGQILGVTFWKNAIGDEMHAELATAEVMIASNVIEGITVDSGTGGTNTIRNTSQFTEFDA